MKTGKEGKESLNLARNKKIIEKAALLDLFESENLRESVATSPIESCSI